MKSIKLSWRVNNEIRANEVRVLASDGKQLGVLSKTEAIELAQKEGLDLVEIAPKAIPPVCKITNLGKLRYQEEKKRRREIKNTRSSELKEIRLSPFIAENDYNTRMVRVREFLIERNKVRVVVVFKGTQMGSRQFGYDLLAKVRKELGETANMDGEPKFFGRHLAMIVSPTKQVVVLTKNGRNIKNAESKNQKISNKTL